MTLNPFMLIGPTAKTHDVIKAGGTWASNLYFTLLRFLPLST
jgi:hypothetical protein